MRRAIASLRTRADRAAVAIIRPARRRITLTLIARTAWAGVRTPNTSMSAPPNIATAGRSIGKRRIVRSEIRTYVTRKTAVAKRRPAEVATEPADWVCSYRLLLTTF